MGRRDPNWTLHFIISPTDRARYLHAVHAALAPGGVLILTEKTRQDASRHHMYHAWKQAPPQNVSAAEVQAKAARIKGVLVSLPAVVRVHTRGMRLHARDDTLGPLWLSDVVAHKAPAAGVQAQLRAPKSPTPPPPATAPSAASRHC